MSCMYNLTVVDNFTILFSSSDSPLAHMSDAIIDYVVGKDLLEPLGGAPTSSIIMQV